MDRDKRVIDRRIAERIALARREKKLSRSETAERVGMDWETYVGIEKAEARISALQITGIAQTLGKPIKYFFEDISKR